MEKSKEPLSAQAIIGRVGEGVDPATIYRVIKGLKERNLIRAVDLRHNHAHYELASGKKHHHHIVCERCGRVEDARRCDPLSIEQSVLENSREFLSIKTHSIEFFGLCKKCAARRSHALIQCRT
jgi:Fur family transcriptional regulator, ferric uptake regulator